MPLYRIGICEPTWFLVPLPKREFLIIFTFKEC